MQQKKCSPVASVSKSRGREEQRVIGERGAQGRCEGRTARRAEKGETVDRADNCEAVWLRRTLVIAALFLAGAAAHGRIIRRGFRLSCLSIEFLFGLKGPHSITPYWKQAESGILQR